MITATRYHDISCGHRVVGHESKCAHIHGHNYRIIFRCTTNELDSVGRVIDFSDIKKKLCFWLEDNWDHKFLVWEQDPLLGKLLAVDVNGIIKVPFNPTAENIAKFLVEQLGPKRLEHTGVVLRSCTIEETRKCSATYSLHE